MRAKSRVTKAAFGQPIVTRTTAHTASEATLPIYHVPLGGKE